LRIVGPDDFRGDFTSLRIPVAVEDTNEIHAKLEGPPGWKLRLEIVGIDDEAPRVLASVAPEPNTAGWNDSDVTVTFTREDQLSGIATCPDPITLTEDAEDREVSGTATDRAGNTGSVRHATRRAV
ncbi:MAG: hypothetical protein O7E49_08410, partial [Gemmatimonadetes bacterium]|nr:hypothetical protein [Gemmatimonadota bacterium]